MFYRKSMLERQTVDALVWCYGIPNETRQPVNELVQT